MLLILCLDIHKSPINFILLFLEVLIRSVALQISGAADLSGLDAIVRSFTVPHLVLRLLTSAMSSQLLAVEYAS